MEQEIDLRPVFYALLRRWKFILACAVVLALMAIVVTLLLRPSGTTVSAEVMLLPTRERIQFDPRFVTEDTSTIANPTTQRNALVALASSSLLEAQVRAALPATASEAYAPGDLFDLVTIQPDGDLIRFTTSDTDPDWATTLVTTWATEYVRLVNQVYSRDIAAIGDLEVQQAEARQAYEAAQSELETFVSANNILRTEQEISATLALLEEAEVANQQLYRDYLDRVRELDLLILDAQTLRRQLAAGQAGGIGESLAALGLQARAAGVEDLPFDLQLNAAGELNVDPAALAGSLDALIANLQERRAALAQIAQEFAQSLVNGEADTMAMTTALRSEYEQRLADLSRTLEAQQSTERLLTQQRDQALQSIFVLQSKINEQLVAQGATQVDVRLVGVAPQPAPSLLRSLVLNTFIAGFVGLFLGVFLVLFLDVVRPWLQKQTARPDQSQTPSDTRIDQPSLG